MHGEVPYLLMTDQDKSRNFKNYDHRNTEKQGLIFDVFF